MQRIELSSNRILFFRAVKGDAGYSNFSLLNELGNIFFHVSFRWEKGEAFSNTKVNGVWSKETRILRKLGNEASLVIRPGISGPPEILFSNDRRLVKPAAKLASGEQFETTCDMDYQGDFDFVSLVDISSFSECDFIHSPQNYAPITVAGQARIVDRSLTGGSTADDRYLSEALEATISAAELPKVERAVLGSPSLSFAAGLLAQNGVADKIEIYGQSPGALRKSLKDNGILTEGFEFHDQKNFGKSAATAGLIAGAGICDTVPAEIKDVSVFSIEEDPLSLACLEQRIAANQRLHLRSRNGNWKFDTSDPQETGGLDIALDVCIAAFNSEDYLEECVRSILDTPCSSINAVVVNDGSTDGTEALAHKLAKQDDRIRVVTKPNGGCASARNYGRLVSNASHIAFVDADDFVDPGYFEHLFNLALHSGYEIVQAGFMNFDHKTKQSSADVEAKILSDLNTIPFGNLKVRQLPSDILMIGQPAIWRRVYRRDFLDAKKITFPENVRAFDDYIFQMRTLNAAGDVLHIDDLFYRYRQHEGQDIRKADARHFYELYMFRQLIKVANEEGWPNVAPLMNSMVNSINWTASKLQNKLVGPFLDAAAEVVVSAEKAFSAGILSKPVVELVHHPDFRHFHRQWETKLADLPAGYWAGYVTYAPEHPLLIDWN